MKNKKPARKYSSPVIKQLLSEISPVEKKQTYTKMTIAARLDDLIKARGWSKSVFAEKVNKNPSEITKWLSGTQNFTIDTLAEIAFALNMPIAELFEPQNVQVINKMQIFIAVKEANPGIKNVTPWTSFQKGSSKYYYDVLQDAMPPLTSYQLS